MAKSKKMTNYKAALQERLKDPEYAAEYLNAAAEEEDAPETLILAIRDVAEARGISALAKSAALNRESLYRMLSGRGNPTYISLRSILNSMGMRLAFQPRPMAAMAARRPAPAAKKRARATASEKPVRHARLAAHR